MNRVLALALGSAALCVACAGPREIDRTDLSTGLGSPVVENGTVYTPVSRSSHGCLLYSVRIPDGQAPAALVYRSVEGQFSYGRPERCFKSPNMRP